MSQSPPKESPCPDCGEMVRINSLRCWNCGAFMNPELEKKFLAMQANPGPTIFSEVPGSEVSTYDEEDNEGDFELSVPPSGKSSPAPDAQETGESKESPAAKSPESRDSGEATASSPESEVSHSVATGGDALLDIAIQEERDRRKRMKGRRQIGGMRTPGGGLIIFCPYGCRVVVKEQHRGMTGKCPRCGAPFLVPTEPPQFKKEKEEVSAPGAAVSSGAPTTWIEDLHLHVVNPEKLKLKADSLLKDFVEVDVGCLPGKIVVAALGKKAGGGVFAKGASSKKEELRETLLQHFQEGKPIEDLAVGTRYHFDEGDLSQLKVVQPAASRGESIFHGIPVFGEGRIAVQLPLNEQTKDPTYLSMGITQFWKLASAIEETYGITGLGTEAGIPPQHAFSTYQCHYTEALIKGLEHVEFYKADPTVELEVTGFQCGACRLTVSEAARKKENLGGKSPKGIAKAKCPKCGNKMGEHPVYSLKSDASEPSMSST